MQQFAQKPDSIDEMTLATLFELMGVLKGLISICDGSDPQCIEQGRTSTGTQRWRTHLGRQRVCGAPRRRCLEGVSERRGRVRGE
eukprot:228936-Pyramimonas_sp.AAC.1